MNEKLNLETGEYEKVEIVSDNLPANMEIEPTIDFTPLEISFNYDELKEIMTKGLEDYKIEVTSENIKDANKMATKLNKLATTIKRARIDNKRQMIEPLNKFENKMKDLEETALMGREFITSQVKFFNDKLVNICLSACNKYLKVQYIDKQVSEEFQYVDISDIAIVSNLSDAMNLTKKARDTIESRVNIALSKQINKQMRLMKLENECLKSGLQVLLNEDDVSSFILESDLKYNEQLAILINRELEKQKQIEDVKAQYKKSIEKETGVKIVHYTATFEMEVSNSVSLEDIKKKYDLKMREFSTTFKDSKIL